MSDVHFPFVKNNAYLYEKGVDNAIMVADDDGYEYIAPQNANDFVYYNGTSWATKNISTLSNDLNLSQYATKNTVFSISDSVIPYSKGETQMNMSIPSENGLYYIGLNNGIAQLQKYQSTNYTNAFTDLSKTLASPYTATSISQGAYILGGEIEIYIADISKMGLTNYEITESEWLSVIPTIQIKNNDNVIYEYKILPNQPHQTINVFNIFTVTADSSITISCSISSDESKRPSLTGSDVLLYKYNINCIRMS